MRIRQITIENWRSIREVAFTANNKSILIGGNNHGKSNILAALRFFFGDISSTDADYNDKSREIVVELVFENLDAQDRKSFEKYVNQSGGIRVRKVAAIGMKEYYKGYRRIPQENDLREENVKELTDRTKANESIISHLLPKTGQITQKKVREAQEEYIMQNSSSIEYKEELESTDFMGQKNVAQGIFGNFFFIPAIKEPGQELKPQGKSLFGALYQDIWNTIISTNQDFTSVKETIENLCSALNRKDLSGNANTNRPEELQALEENLKAELAEWDVDLEIEITPPELDHVFANRVNLHLDDGVRTMAENKGHGLQRALLFALVKVLAKKVESDASGVRRRSASNYIVIEEPELYLHPHAQRTLHEDLTTISDSYAQVFLCTHSSHFITLEEYRSLVIARRSTADQVTQIYQRTSDIFKGEEEISRFNLSYWLNPDRAELFFARKVILVEGQTDKSVLLFAARTNNISASSCSIIDCGSKSSISAYCKLLNAFRIPYAVLMDKDHQTNKGPQAIETANSENETIRNAIDGTIGTLIEIVNDMEEEIGMIEKKGRNKPYRALEHLKSNGLPNSLLDKVRIAFA